MCSTQCHLHKLHTVIYVDIGHIHIATYKFITIFIFTLFEYIINTIEWQDLYEKNLSNEWLLGNFIT